MSEVRKTPAVRYLLPLGAVLLVLGLYSNAMRNHFIMDDQPIIVENDDVMTKRGLVDLWTHPVHVDRAVDVGHYRPLAVATFNLNAYVSEYQLNVKRFRFVNVVLLGLLGWLTAWWFGRFVEHPGAGWLAVLLLLVHPANAELVNHITARADTMAMLGVVGFLLSQRRAMLEDGWTPMVSLAAVGFALLAFGSKETGLLLIPAAAAQTWLAWARNHKEPIPHLSRVTLQSVLWLVLPVSLYVAARYAALHGLAVPLRVDSDIDGNPVAALGLDERLPVAAALAWFYFRQVIWPSTAYGHTPDAPPTWAHTEPYLGLMVLLAGVCALIWAVRRKHWLLVPLVIAAGHYVLVCQLLTPIGTYAANRLTLPFLLLAAALVTAWLDRRTYGSTRRRAVAVLPVSILAAALAFTVYTTNPDWYATVQRRAIDAELQPMSLRAQYHFAVALTQKPNVTDEDQRNARHMLESIAATPLGQDSPGVAYELGMIHLRLRELTEAEQCLEHTLKLRDDHLPAHLALADLHMDRLQLDTAADHLTTASMLVEKDPLLHTHVGDLLKLRRRLEQLREDEQRFPKPDNPLDVTASRQSAAD